MSEEPRIVIDTQVFLRAAINEKSLPAKLVFRMKEIYRLIVSDVMLAEVKDVLSRDSIRRKFPQLSDEIVANLLSRLGSAETVVLSEIPAISRDPKDDMVLATALSGRAGFIISEDKDLLVLNPYEEIQIVNVLDIVKTLESKEE